MSHLALSLFGPPSIARDGVTIIPDTRKATALIAYLAVTGQRQSRDTLATLLWPEYDQPHARATLRRTLSTLNKALDGQGLKIDRETVGLDTRAGIWVDVVEFQQSMKDCREHEHPATEGCARCLGALTRAVTLYRDDFMAGFALHDSITFDDWQIFQADSLRREQANALERLVHCYGALEDLSTAILYARRWLALDRLHEPAHRTLMQLYARSGQRAMFIQQYQECSRILQEELGVAPLEATRQLYEAIKRNHLPPLTPQAGPPARHFIPACPPAAQIKACSDIPLIGRGEEWALLSEAYENAETHGHIAIIEGEAGMGKTRLVEEFLACWRARGARTITARCHEGESYLAYAPIAAALRAAIAQQQDQRWHEKIAVHWLSEVARLLPELASACPGLAAMPPCNSPGAQNRFFEGIRQVLLAICSDESSQLPGILFFDDIHTADDATRDLLSYLAYRLDSAPLLLILTWRPHATTVQRLARIVSETARATRSTWITLSHLDRTALHQLLQATVSSKPSQALLDRFYFETEGLPRIATAYLAALKKGELTDDDEEWPVPADVRRWLSTQLTLPAENDRRVLSAAAIIGRSFDFDSLCEVSGYGEEEVICTLETLIEQGLVRESQENTGYLAGEQTLMYEFFHGKLHRLLYEETSKARRRLLQRRIAELLAPEKSWAVEKLKPIPARQSAAMPVSRQWLARCI